MSDVDYLKPDEREAIPLANGTLLDSHAVADSVMADLADALRRSVYAACPYGPDDENHTCECSVCTRSMVREAALARFDTVIGGDHV